MSFCLALRSTCTIVADGEGRQRFDNARKNVFFLGIVLNLHYLCPKELKLLINLLFSLQLEA